MTPDLHERVKARRHTIEQNLEHRLRTSAAFHYRTEDLEKLSLRCQKLVDVFLSAAAGDLLQLMTYVDQVAHERITAGYHLEEVLGALNLLQEELWDLLVSEVQEREPLIQFLGLATSIVGLAKDRFSSIFLQRQAQAETRLEQMQQRMDSLFAGTASSQVND